MKKMVLSLILVVVLLVSVVPAVLAALPEICQYAQYHYGIMIYCATMWLFEFWDPFEWGEY